MSKIVVFLAGGNMLFWNVGNNMKDYICGVTTQKTTVNTFTAMRTIYIT
jgi:hypothetical protein